MSRVETMFLPEMGHYEAYVKSLLHMARTLDGQSSSYGKMKRVVIVGTSYRNAEAYVKTALNSNSIPDNVFCLGLDQAPDKYKNGSYLGSHVVLMFDLMYASESALGKLADRLFDIIWTLKRRPEDKDTKDGQLYLVGQNWRVWDSMIEYGARTKTIHGQNVQFFTAQSAYVLASSVTFNDVLSDENAIDGKIDVTIGADFQAVDLRSLISKLQNIRWLLGCGEKPDRKLVLHPCFQRALFEEYLLSDFQGL